jgi:hypothetical protein
MAMMDAKDVKYTVELNIECIFERETNTTWYHQDKDDDFPYLNDDMKAMIADHIEDSIKRDFHEKYGKCDLKIDVLID